MHISCYWVVVILVEWVGPNMTSHLNILIQHQFHRLLSSILNSYESYMFFRLIYPNDPKPCFWVVILYSTIMNGAPFFKLIFIFHILFSRPFSLLSPFRIRPLLYLRRPEKKDWSIRMSASHVLRNFGCSSIVTLQISRHICYQFTIVCKLCPVEAATTRTVDCEKRNNQTISSTRVMRMLKLWIRLSDLKWKKAHPARSESSLRQERSGQRQEFERFLRRRSTMVLWHSNPPFPGLSIVFWVHYALEAFAMRNLRLQQVFCSAFSAVVCRQ